MKVYFVADPGNDTIPVLRKCRADRMLVSCVAGKLRTHLDRLLMQVNQKPRRLGFSDSEGKTKKKPTTSLEAVEWASRINKMLTPALEATVRAYVDVGRELLKAKAQLPHGAWTSMFRGAEHPVPEPIPFSIDRGQLLMRVARHPVLSQPEMAVHLPPHWTFLARLARLPEDLVRQWITEDRIFPNMAEYELATLEMEELQSSGRFDKLLEKQARLRVMKDGLTRKMEERRQREYNAQRDRFEKHPGRRVEDGPDRAGVDAARRQVIEAGYRALNTEESEVAPRLLDQAVAELRYDEGQRCPLCRPWRVSDPEAGCLGASLNRRA